jgi:hypothetical protein
LRLLSHAGDLSALAIRATTPTSSKEHFLLTEELKATLHKAFLISQGIKISDYKGIERKNEGN